MNVSYRGVRVGVLEGVGDSSVFFFLEFGIGPKNRVGDDSGMVDDCFTENPHSRSVRMMNAPPKGILVKRFNAFRPLV